MNILHKLLQLFVSERDTVLSTHQIDCTSPSGETLSIRHDWPQPAVVSAPEIYTNDSIFVLRYINQDHKTVVIQIPMCNYFAFGAPNDEVLGGHPLYAKGLKHYTIHEVNHSSLIQRLERQNSVHPRHDKALFQDIRHFIMTFQDSTLECVFTDNDYWRPNIVVCDSKEMAEQQWKLFCDR